MTPQIFRKALHWTGVRVIPIKHNAKLNRTDNTRCAPPKAGKAERRPTTGPITKNKADYSYVQTFGKYYVPCQINYRGYLGRR